MSDNNCPYCGAEQDSSSSCPQCEKDRCPFCKAEAYHRQIVYIQGTSPITGGSKDVDRTFFYCGTHREIILWKEDKPIEFKQSDTCKIARLTSLLAATAEECGRWRYFAQHLYYGMGSNSTNEAMALTDAALRAAGAKLAKLAGACPNSRPGKDCPMGCKCDDKEGE